jgi:hypothetical protein
MGHEYQFPPPRLNARCVIGEETFAGRHGSRRVAPKDPMGVRIATGALPEWGC